MTEKSVLMPHWIMPTSKIEVLNTFHFLECEERMAKNMMEFESYSFSPFSCLGLGVKQYLEALDSEILKIVDFEKFVQKIFESIAPIDENSFEEYVRKLKIIENTLESLAEFTVSFLRIVKRSELKRDSRLVKDLFVSKLLPIIQSY